MIKKIFFFLIFYTPLLVLSQNFKAGCITGISTSQVSGDNLAGYHKAGLFIGLFTEYPLSNITNLKLEMNYIEKGSNNPKILENNIPDISTSYLEVPLSINYYQNKITAFEIGLSCAFLLNATDNDIYGPIQSSIDRPFNKIDLSGFIGIDYHLTKKIVLNSRISNSIIPIRNHISGATFLLNKGQYNTILSFTIHYYLSL